LDNLKYLKNKKEGKPFIVSETILLHQDPEKNKIVFTLTESAEVRIGFEKD